MTNAVVVGAGPNGLAAAVALARGGIEVTVLEADDRIGGGAKSSELTVPGVLHDECAGIHPMGAASPFLRSLGLERFGLTWLWPEIDCAHPLDCGSAAALYRSIDQTAAGLGADGDTWLRLFGPLVPAVDDLLVEVLQPIMHVPRHTVTLARFALRVLPSATSVARLLTTAQARALYSGNVAHAFHPFNRLLVPSIGTMIISVGHRYGWPVAEGGSQAITNALAAVLRTLGAEIETGVRVRSLAELLPAEIVMLDLMPGTVLEVAGDLLPPQVRRAYRRWRHGPAAFKVDFAVQGGVPWKNEDCRRAGTVHLGGTFEQVAAAERTTHRGGMPARPFVLVGQQYLADPSRSAGDVHPVYAYAHVPHAYPGDATEAITNQIERFAPGFRARVIARTSRSTAALATHNANLIGGDIVGGLNSARQLVLRPRAALDPYWTGIPGVYLCSAATPPGAGVHCMSGFNAAQSALCALSQGR
ncbi:MAG TPA: NAD(P)/FAD-dependent oxidoreductase [Pseudonocardiaceae bacterium]